MDNRAVLLLGHPRWRTRGDERVNSNNDSIRAGEVIGTHNGTIYNADYLFRRWKLRRFAEVDSPAVGGIPPGRERRTGRCHGYRAVQDPAPALPCSAPGEYRRIQNYVVNSVTGETIYTPPPAHDVPIMMAELVDWLNQEKGIHPVLVSGISQFQFVHIHPFLDGNGRTSRLLATLCLYRAGYDFKRLFTISEYYDRDRPAFYRAIQSVREHGMDMTGWLEYFVDGLTAQLAEVRERGEQAIRRDVLVKKHRLSDRQAKALAYILEYGSLSIQDFEGLCPDVNRRSLQRDLKAMVDRGMIVTEGETHQLLYRLTEGD